MPQVVRVLLVPASGMCLLLSSVCGAALHCQVLPPLLETRQYPPAPKGTDATEERSVRLAVVVAQAGVRSSSVDQSTSLIIGGEQVSLPTGIARMPGVHVV